MIPDGQTVFPLDKAAIREPLLITYLHVWMPIWGWRLQCLLVLQQWTWASSYWKVA